MHDATFVILAVVKSEREQQQSMLQLILQQNQQTKITVLNPSQFIPCKVMPEVKRARLMILSTKELS